MTQLRPAICRTALVAWCLVAASCSRPNPVGVYETDRVSFIEAVRSNIPANAPDSVRDMFAELVEKQSGDWGIRLEIAGDRASGRYQMTMTLPMVPTQKVHKGKWTFEGEVMLFEEDREDPLDPASGETLRATLRGDTLTLEQDESSPRFTLHRTSR